MQTFLPERSFEQCAQVLDQKRLVKQLLEARQIFGIIVADDPTKKGWVNHPAVKQWRGYIPLLYQYCFAIYTEMGVRGYNGETNWGAINDSWNQYVFKGGDPTMRLPIWWDEREPNVEYKRRVVITHKKRLWEKEPVFYKQYRKWQAYGDLVCCTGCQYFWPTHILDKW